LCAYMVQILCFALLFKEKTVRYFR
jgi:hypothetical protein